MADNSAQDVEVKLRSGKFRYQKTLVERMEGKRRQGGRYRAIHDGDAKVDGWCVKFDGEHEAGTAGNRFNHRAQTIL